MLSPQERERSLLSPIVLFDHYRLRREWRIKRFFYISLGLFLTLLLTLPFGLFVQFGTHPLFPSILHDYFSHIWQLPKAWSYRYIAWALYYGSWIAWLPAITALLYYVMAKLLHPFRTDRPFDPHKIIPASESLIQDMDLYETGGASAYLPIGKRFGCLLALHKYHSVFVLTPSHSHASHSFLRGTFAAMPSDSLVIADVDTALLSETLKKRAAYGNVYALVFDDTRYDKVLPSIRFNPLSPSMIPADPDVRIRYLQGLAATLTQANTARTITSDTMKLVQNTLSALALFIVEHHQFARCDRFLSPEKTQNPYGLEPTFTWLFFFLSTLIEAERKQSDDDNDPLSWHRSIPYTFKVVERLSREQEYSSYITTTMEHLLKQPLPLQCQVMEHVISAIAVFNDPRIEAKTAASDIDFAWFRGVPEANGTFHPITVYVAKHHEHHSKYLVLSALFCQALSFYLLHHPANGSDAYERPLGPYGVTFVINQWGQLPYISALQEAVHSGWHHHISYMLLHHDLAAIQQTYLLEAYPLLHHATAHVILPNCTLRALHFYCAFAWNMRELLAGESTSLVSEHLSVTASYKALVHHLFHLKAPTHAILYNGQWRHPIHARSAYPWRRIQQWIKKVSSTQLHPSSSLSPVHLRMYGYVHAWEIQSAPLTRIFRHIKRRISLSPAFFFLQLLIERVQHSYKNTSASCNITPNYDALTPLNPIGWDLRDHPLLGEPTQEIRAFHDGHGDICIAFQSKTYGEWVVAHFLSHRLENYGHHAFLAYYKSLHKHHLPLRDRSTIVCADNSLYRIHYAKNTELYNPFDAYVTQEKADGSVLHRLYFPYLREKPILKQTESPRVPGITELTRFTFATSAPYGFIPLDDHSFLAIFDRMIVRFNQSFETDFTPFLTHYGCLRDWEMVLAKDRASDMQAHNDRIEQMLQALKLKPLL